jgi:TPR repeat protein
MPNKLVMFYLFILLTSSLSFASSPDQTNSITIDQSLMEKANEGDANAQYSLGEIYYKTKDYDQAIKWYLRSAEQGNPFAQVNLGGMYEMGLVQEKKKIVVAPGLPEIEIDQKTSNHQQSFEWYKKAAEQGYSVGQYHYGLMFFHGYGTEKDPNQAIKWFMKASEQGYCPALCILGEIYEEGKVVPQDYKEAVKWFIKAVEQECPYCNEDIKSMYKEGKCELQYYEKVLKLIKKKADQGDESAQYELAGMYFNGDVLIPQDYTKAINWYLKLAEKDGIHARIAQYQLGLIYSGKYTGVSQNYIEAYKWLIIASLESEKSDEGFNKYCAEVRDSLRAKMSLQQITDAQKLAKEFVENKGKERSTK